jgi:hypothetical protein
MEGIPGKPAAQTPRKLFPNTLTTNVLAQSNQSMPLSQPLSLTLGRYSDNNAEQQVIQYVLNIKSMGE